MSIILFPGEFDIFNSLDLVGFGAFILCQLFIAAEIFFEVLRVHQTVFKNRRGVFCKVVAHVD